MSFLAGQLLDKAATQEAELRKAKQELTRKQEAERRMANEMRAPVSFVSLHAFEPATTSRRWRRTCEPPRHRAGDDVASVAWNL